MTCINERDLIVAASFWDEVGTETLMKLLQGINDLRARNIIH